MAKKENTALWIIGIVVAVLVLAQFADIGNGAFAIAGGGAGSSISQRIGPTQILVDASAYGEGMWEDYIVVVRPPVGETWLITATSWNIEYTDFAMVDPPASGATSDVWESFWETQVFRDVPITDRLFIDHNFYIIEGVSSTSSGIKIVGVRV